MNKKKIFSGWLTLVSEYFFYISIIIYNALNNFAKLYNNLISDNGNLNILINFINAH